jgi:uncharacterized protein
MEGHRMTDEYDYTALVDNAMRGVVRDVLRQVHTNGLADPHHFFVTFRTDHPGVMMSEMLRSKYPHEITIVLQHQYRELKVEQDYFKVVLSFSNIPEKLTIPFAALTGFADPSVKFGLQFHMAEGGEEVQALVPTRKIPDVKTETKSVSAAEDEDGKESTKVIALDAFRKK